MSNTKRAKRHVPLRNPKSITHRVSFDKRRSPGLTTAMLDAIADMQRLNDEHGSRVQSITVLVRPEDV